MQESWENYENKGISHSFTYTTMPKKFATSQWTSAEQAEENNKKNKMNKSSCLIHKKWKLRQDLQGFDVCITIIYDLKHDMWHVGSAP